MDDIVELEEAGGGGVGVGVGVGVEGEVEDDAATMAMLTYDSGPVGDAIDRVVDCLTTAQPPKRRKSGRGAGSEMTAVDLSRVAEWEGLEKLRGAPANRLSVFGNAMGTALLEVLKRAGGVLRPEVQVLKKGSAAHAAFCEELLSVGVGGGAAGSHVLNMKDMQGHVQGDAHVFRVDLGGLVFRVVLSKPETAFKLPPLTTYGRAPVLFVDVVGCFKSLWLPHPVESERKEPRAKKAPGDNKEGKKVKAEKEMQTLWFVHGVELSGGRDGLQVSVAGGSGGDVDPIMWKSRVLAVAIAQTMRSLVLGGWDAMVNVETTDVPEDAVLFQVVSALKLLFRTVVHTAKELVTKAQHNARALTKTGRSARAGQRAAAKKELEDEESSEELEHVDTKKRVTRQQKKRRLSVGSVGDGDPRTGALVADHSEAESAGMLYHTVESALKVVGVSVQPPADPSTALLRVVMTLRSAMDALGVDAIDKLSKVVYDVAQAKNAFKATEEALRHENKRLEATVAGLRDQLSVVIFRAGRVAGYGAGAGVGAGAGGGSGFVADPGLGGPAGPAVPAVPDTPYFVGAGSEVDYSSASDSESDGGRGGGGRNVGDRSTPAGRSGQVHAKVGSVNEDRVGRGGVSGGHGHGRGHEMLGTTAPAKASAKAHAKAPAPPAKAAAKAAPLVRGSKPK
jgi:hypothetical protein